MLPRVSKSWNKAENITMLEKPDSSEINNQVNELWSGKPIYPFPFVESKQKIIAMFLKKIRVTVCPNHRNLKTQTELLLTLRL